MHLISRWIFIFYLILLSISACQTNSSEGKKSSGIQKSISNIEGYVVKSTVVEHIINISGTLKPYEETVLMPDIAGRVVKINYLEGQLVKQGTLLFKLFDDDLQAQLQKLETQLKIAEQTFSRQSELLKVEGISQSEYDLSKLQVNSIEGDIDIVKAQIRKTEIIAPFDGVIGLRNISVGAIVNPATSLATIRQVNILKLDFNVPGKYGADIRKGMKVRFSVQGNDKKYDAEVTATEEGIDASTRNLKVRAQLIANDKNLVPGAFATVELHLNEGAQSLVVPTQSIIPQERNKKVIVSKGGKAYFVTVKTGIRQASTIEVLSGLQIGDTVVISGIQFIKPESIIKFSKVIQ